MASVSGAGTRRVLPLPLRRVARGAGGGGEGGSGESERIDGVCVRTEEPDKEGVLG